MEASVWGLIGTLIGAIVGAAASIITTYLASKNSADLQREADSQERMERARSFQRETLLAVQDALHDALRLMMRAHQEDLASHRAGTVWGKGMLSTDLDETSRVANRRLALLNERIAHDSLRNELKALRRNIAHLNTVSSEHKAEALVQSSVQMADVFMENLGDVLRKTY
jgi:gas vesicle protein